TRLSGRATLQCPLGKVSERARRRRPLRPRGATVFENSTACAPDRLRPCVAASDLMRPGSSTPAAHRVVRHLKQTSSIASGCGHVYGRRPSEMRDSSLKQFFTESLILAQD